MLEKTQHNYYTIHLPRKQYLGIFISVYQLQCNGFCGKIRLALHGKQKDEISLTLVAFGYIVHTREIYAAMNFEISNFCGYNSELMQQKLHRIRTFLI